MQSLRPAQRSANGLLLQYVDAHSVDAKTREHDQQEDR
jgi:hypothetical protein